MAASDIRVPAGNGGTNHSSVFIIGSPGTWQTFSKKGFMSPIKLLVLVQKKEMFVTGYAGTGGQGAMGWEGVVSIMSYFELDD